MQLVKALFEEMSDGVVLARPDVTIQYVNPAFELLSGYQRGELVGHSPALLKSGHHPNTFYDAMWFDLKSQGHWDGEIINRRSNGEVYAAWLSLSKITNQEGRHISYLGIFKPIAERYEKGSAAYLRASHYDFLTGLPNRLLFQEKMNAAIGMAKRHIGRFALLYVSLDDLQVTNEIYGYQIGDKLLQNLAGRLKKRMRASDSIARLQGNDFAIILTDVKHLEEVGMMIRNFINWLNLPVQIEKLTLSISASVGVAVYPDDSTAADELLRQSSAAMREARLAGKGRFCFYSQKIQ